MAEVTLVPSGLPINSFLTCDNYRFNSPCSIQRPHFDTIIRDLANAANLHRLCQVQVRSKTSDPPRTIGHLSTSVLLPVELPYLSVGRIQSLLWPFMQAACNRNSFLLLLPVFHNNNNFPKSQSHVLIRTFSVFAIMCSMATFKLGCTTLPSQPGSVLTALEAQPYPRYSTLRLDLQGTHEDHAIRSVIGSRSITLGCLNVATIIPTSVPQYTKTPHYLKLLAHPVEPQRTTGSRDIFGSRCRGRTTASETPLI